MVTGPGRPRARWRIAVAALVVALTGGCDALAPSGPGRAAEMFDDEAVVELIEAASAGDADGVSAAIEAGADVHAESNDHDPRRTGITPLHYAVEFLSPEAVTLLLEAGADPRRPTADGRYNAPAYALMRYSGDTFATLLEADPTLAETPYLGESGNLLHGAVGAEQAEELALLIDAGADLDARDPGGKTPLHAAAMVRGVDACLTLVRAGADASLRDNRGDIFLPYLYATDDEIASENFLTARDELVRELEERGFPVETEFAARKR